MSLPPRARSVTPTPTLPPPLADEPSAVQRFVSKVDTWKAILGVIIAALGAGATAYAWQLGKADVAELHQVRDGAAAALSAAQAGSTAQLGALQSTVQDLRARQAGVDASLDSLKTDVARLNSSADRLYLQLVEIARATGARQVREPTPSKGTP